MKKIDGISRVPTPVYGTDNLELAEQYMKGYITLVEYLRLMLERDIKAFSGKEKVS